jgi:SAM-dependent methyltransferase
VRPSLDRPNFLLRQQEAWQPPAFETTNTFRGRVLAWARRLLDLQAGSMWRDLSRLLPQCKGRVLDVGCGAQPYRRLFHSTAQYVGIDTKDAKAHFGYEMPDTLYFEGTTWPVTSSAFDVVLATEVLEHAPDTAVFLGEARRCLEPGGLLVLTVPFAARWHYIPYDFWRFTPSGLHRVLQEAGFRDVVVYARGNELTVACYKVMALILPLLFGKKSGVLATVARRLMGLLLTPLLLILACIANISMLGNGGNDCLGYTAVATRSDAAGEENRV